jgi:choline dehydrogenase-like flavoprotein
MDVETREYERTKQAYGHGSRFRNDPGRFPTPGMISANDAKASAVNVETKYHTKEVWHDKDGNELHPHTNYYVGGNTKFYGAALFRLRREDFGEIRHHGGLSPAWPISYDRDPAGLPFVRGTGVPLVSACTERPANESSKVP